MKQILISQHRQKGIAAILILVTLGLALTATMLGSAHYLRTSQEQHMVLHTQTVAEARVWTAAEALRDYLEEVAKGEGEWERLAVGDSFSMDGLDGFVEASIIDITQLGSASHQRLTTRLVASAAQNTRAESATVLEMVYDITRSSASGEAPGPQVGVRINVNLDYSGGGLAIIDGVNMADFATSGDINVSNASEAITSGCAKGDVNYSGGGIANNARLVSEGLITLRDMTPPRNLFLWAENVRAEQYGGTYSSILAGAFEADVQSGDRTIGRVVTGGNVRNDNKIVPGNTGVALITLTDGTRFRVQLDAISISDAVITKNDAAIRLAGNGELPNSFAFVYTGVSGGSITVTDATVAEMWGNEIRLPGWNYTIDELKVHGDTETNTARIGRIQAGGDWVVKSGDQPTLARPSEIGGRYIGGNAPRPLTTRVPGASPGLPGTPFCEVEPDRVDIERYKDDANYVFYFENSKPMLKIQNLRLSSTDAPINQIFNLSTDDVRYLRGFPFFQCSWGVQNCFSNVSPSRGWMFTGVNSLPPGILWFDGDVTFNGMTSNTRAFYNSVLATGDLTLGSGGGHQTLRAPNFSDPALSCGGPFYLANLCDKSVSPPDFVVDSGGRKGLPLANSAILIEGNLTASGWTIHGNVSLGEGLRTSGAKVTIKGGLSVGGNRFSVMDIKSGGLTVDLSSVTQDQVHYPDQPGDSGGAGGTTSASATILWGRYL